MENFIAFCGFDCEKCESRIATINDDDALREAVAKKWSKLNNVEILPEMINCEGCKSNGIKNAFCESLCEIRQCAMNMKVDTCKDCNKKKNCEKINKIASNNPKTKKWLEI